MDYILGRRQRINRYTDNIVSQVIHRMNESKAEKRREVSMRKPVDFAVL